MKSEIQPHSFRKIVGAGLSRDHTVRPQNNRGINPLLHINHWLQSIAKSTWRIVNIYALLPLSLLGTSIEAAEKPIRQAQDRPNIVFVLVDDHAWEAVSAYGSYLKDYATTPTIDSLGRDGMRFDNFVCANSICSPSRASFITGQYSHVNGVKNLG